MIEIKYGNDESNKILHICYLGNEYIILREESHSQEDECEYIKEIKVPRIIFESFCKLISQM